MVKVEDFFYIPSKMDPSHPATRSKYSLADLGQGSEWQQPNFRQFQEWVPVQRLCLLFSTAVPNDEVLAPNDDSTGLSMFAADST